MIAGCPKCGARYRIDTAKLPAEGTRLRCSRCEAVFRVLPPAAASASGARSEAPPSGVGRTSASGARGEAPPSGVGRTSAGGARGEAPPSGAGRTSTAAASDVSNAAADRERLVIIAHPEVAAGKALAEAVAAWGLVPRLVHDGVEAILGVQRLLPRVVVLDAALPKMFGFQVCELMKRNEQLRSIHVVLVGAIHDQARYRRPPGELYGADAYVERHELPNSLSRIFSGFGLPLTGTPPVRPAPEPPASPPAAQPAAPTAPAAAAQGTPAPDVAEAERLARVIVSDVVLYNQEKFDAAVRAGNVVEALAPELEEGYALFAQRVSTTIADPRELLHRELLRVARSRGMN